MSPKRKKVQRHLFNGIQINFIVSYRTESAPMQKLEGMGFTLGPDPELLCIVRRVVDLCERENLLCEASEDHCVFHCAFFPH